MRNLLIFALVLNVCGCAPLITKPDSKDIVELLPPKQKNSITYRVYSKSKYKYVADAGVTLRQEKDFESAIESILKSSEFFSSLKSYENKVGSISLSGQGYKKNEDRLLKIEFPIETEYFVDLESVEINYGPHGGGIMYWGLIHIISLGLIPIKLEQDVDLKMTLYNKIGTILYQGEYSQNSSIWAWTPFFFFNGFRMFVSNQELEKPNREKVTRYLLKKMSEDVKL